MPIIEAYGKKGKCHKVNADRKVEDVWSDVKKIFEDLEKTLN